MGCHIARQSTRRHRYSAGCRGRNPRDRNRGCSRSSSGPGTSTSSLHRTCCSNRSGRRRRRDIARLGRDRRDQTRRRKRKPVSQNGSSRTPIALSSTACGSILQTMCTGHADRGCCSKKLRCARTCTLSIAPAKTKSTTCTRNATIIIASSTPATPRHARACPDSHTINS